MKKILFTLLLACLVLCSCVNNSAPVSNPKDDEDKENSVTEENKAENIEVEPIKGSLEITTQSKSEEILADDGTLLATVSVSYPVIENAKVYPYLRQINERYKKIAEDYFESSLACKDTAKELYEYRKDYFTHFAFELTYTVGINRDGYLSFTNEYYEYTGGAHPNTSFASESYDLKAEKMLVLTDILKPDVQEKVRSTFTPYLEEIFPDYFETSWGGYFEDELPNVRFVLKDTSLELYFNAYDVGPYVMGAPRVEIPYDEENFILDL